VFLSWSCEADEHALRHNKQVLLHPLLLLQMCLEWETYLLMLHCREQNSHSLLHWWLTLQLCLMEEEWLNISEHFIWHRWSTSHFDWHLWLGLLHTCWFLCPAPLAHSTPWQPISHIWSHLWFEEHLHDKSDDFSTFSN
jgi:hypothetical protein